MLLHLFSEIWWVGLERNKESWWSGRSWLCKLKSGQGTRPIYPMHIGRGPHFFQFQSWAGYADWQPSDCLSSKFSEPAHKKYLALILKMTHQIWSKKLNLISGPWHLGPVLHTYFPTCLHWVGYQKQLNFEIIALSICTEVIWFNCIFLNFKTSRQTSKMGVALFFCRRGQFQSKCELLSMLR